MKNIHILPTDKPSRLYLSDYGKEFNLSGYPLRNYTTGQNIYITNDEEIKEGDWHLSFLRDKFEVINYLPNGGYRAECLGKEVCKIILTTDQDLIKDGVQAIDDEFLEWFVKNPSCEFVKIREKGNVHAIVKGRGIKSFKNGYKIIIPKEEQKQALIDMMKSDEELGLYDDTEINRIELVCKDCSDSLEDCTCIQDTIDFPRQEIKLEEVFNDDKKENIKIFIDEIKNPSEPNQALKDAAERLKGKELFKESNDRARKILSEIKSLPIQERYEKYSERFDNDESAIGNPETWGKRVLTEEDIFNQRDIDAVTDYIGKETSKQETLEEAAKGYSERHQDVSGNLGKYLVSAVFQDGAEWQQERSYSEEEVIAFGEFIFKHSLLTHAKGVKNLFEQFKNK